MRLSVQRRLGLPLDVACQAAAAGKKTRNGKTHDEYGDAAVNVPQQGHNTRHKYTLRRLILALRAAWGTAVRMEPKAHLGQSYNKQPDVDADNIGSHGTHYCGDVKVVCPLSSSGEHGRKGAFVAFGNTESFYRNMDRILSKIEAAFDFEEVFDRVVRELMATCMATSIEQSQAVTCDC